MSHDKSLFNEYGTLIRTYSGTNENPPTKTLTVKKPVRSNFKVTTLHIVNPINKVKISPSTTHLLIRIEPNIQANITELIDFSKLTLHTLYIEENDSFQETIFGKQVNSEYIILKLNNNGNNFVISNIPNTRVVSINNGTEASYNIVAPCMSELYMDLSANIDKLKTKTTCDLSIHCSEYITDINNIDIESQSPVFLYGEAFSTQLFESIYNTDIKYMTKNTMMDNKFDTISGKRLSFVMPKDHAIYPHIKKIKCQSWHGDKINDMFPNLEQFIAVSDKWQYNQSTFPDQIIPNLRKLRVMIDINNIQKIDLDIIRDVEKLYIRFIEPYCSKKCSVNEIKRFIYDLSILTSNMKFISITSEGVNLRRRLGDVFPFRMYGTVSYGGLLEGVDINIQNEHVYEYIKSNPDLANFSKAKSARK